MVQVSRKRWHQWVLNLSLLAAPGISQAVTVDVLVLYDTHTQNYFSGQPVTAIRNWVDQVNVIYQNSQIDVQLRLVGTQLNNAPGNNMSEVLGQLRNDSSIATRRTELGADFVTQLHRQGNCGVAYFAVSAAWAYSVVGPQCGPYTLAHELGHNMGLAHSRRQGDTSGVRFAYGLGHGVDGLFGTVMTYEWLFNAPSAGKFSNPRITCSGVPCGVAEGNPQQADAVKAINNVRNELANFRQVGGGGGVVNGPIADGVYTLRARHSNKCADVYGVSTADGANVIQWGCHGGANQRWAFRHLSDGFYEVRAQHSAKCLHVNGTQNGVNIQQRSCNSSSAQQWRVTANGDGSYRLAGRASGLVMDVTNASLADGANIRQWQWSSATHQRWTLQRL